ncbi:hypothetical protein OH77DRAFT_555798 [Trametes cingulata]|nr:hypothetical protein OH77DRAFT_555798 [Trametes cingulata]
MEYFVLRCGEDRSLPSRVCTASKSASRLLMPDSRVRTPWPGPHARLVMAYPSLPTGPRSSSGEARTSDAVVSLSRRRYWRRPASAALRRPWPTPVRERSRKCIVPEKRRAQIARSPFPALLLPKLLLAALLIGAQGVGRVAERGLVVVVAPEVAV